MCGLSWSVGVTTVTPRVNELLPRTLASLYAAEFISPRLFVDGVNIEDRAKWDKFNVPVTLRSPGVGVFGNWILSLHELYLRSPNADRFAIFQDDVIAYRNLKAYLDQSKFPNRGYLNLFTFRTCNERIVAGKDDGWYEASEVDSGAIYHDKKQQTGRGAVALVFNQEAARTLLSSQHMIDKPLDHAFGHRRVDGAIVEALNKAGWREYIHNPSLVQHIGGRAGLSTLGHVNKDAMTFRGEGYNALDLLQDVAGEK